MGRFYRNCKYNQCSFQLLSDTTAYSDANAAARESVLGFQHCATSLKIGEFFPHCTSSGFGKYIQYSSTAKHRSQSEQLQWRFGHEQSEQHDVENGTAGRSEATTDSEQRMGRWR